MIFVILEQINKTHTQNPNLDLGSDLGFAIFDFHPCSFFWSKKHLQEINGSMEILGVLVLATKKCSFPLTKTKTKSMVSKEQQTYHSIPNLPLN